MNSRQPLKASSGRMTKIKFWLQKIPKHKSLSNTFNNPTKS
jgi:hypothetical protein